MQEPPKDVVCSDTFRQSNADVVAVCDGGGLVGSRIGGIGYVIADRNTDEILVEGSIAIESASSTVEIEFSALLQTLEALDQCGASMPTVKTDYKGILRAVKSDGETRIEQMSRIEEILSEFDGWCVQHVSRDETDRADSLARQAYENYE